MLPKRHKVKSINLLSKKVGSEKRLFIKRSVKHIENRWARERRNSQRI